MSDEREPQHDLDRRLRRALAPERVSGARRQQLQLLLREHDERDLRRQQRHSRLELGAVAAVLFLVVATSLWRLAVVNEGPHPTAVPAMGAAPAVTTPATPTQIPAGDTAVEPACDVTPLSASRPPRFVDDTMFVDWYGDEGFWLSPMAISAMYPGVANASPSWFAGGYPVIAIWPSSGTAPLHVSGHMRADPSVTLSTTKAPSTFASQFMLSFPEPGCWELTASSDGHTLTLAIDVRPITERPDIVAALEHVDLLPYEPPATCAVTPWTGPNDLTSGFSPYFWIRGQGIAARSTTGIVWAAEPTSFDWVLDEWGPLVVTGRSVASGLAPEQVAEHVHRVTYDGKNWLSTLSFPEPGCWELDVTSNEHSLHAVIWVYPPECKRNPGEEIPALCERPD